MIRILALATARLNLAAAQTVAVAAAADLAAKELALADASALPLDTFASAVEGLDAFLDDSGYVRPQVNIVVSGWPSSLSYGQSILPALGAAPFPQSRGPATPFRDDAGRLQFRTDGSEIEPVPTTLLITRYKNDDLPPDVATIVISWA